MLFNLSSHIWVQNSHQPWVILTQLQTTRPRSIINQTLNIHVQQNSSVAVRNFNTLMDLYATSLSSDAKKCYQSLFLGYWNYVISWTSLLLHRCIVFVPKICICSHHCITWHAPGQALSSLRIFKFRSTSKAQKNVLATW